jgi:hypothetical protein
MMNAKHIQAKAFGDQISASARDTGTKVVLSQFEVESLVMLANVGLMAWMVHTGTKADKARQSMTAMLDQMTRDCEQHESAYNAQGVLAAMLNADRLCQYDIYRGPSNAD